LALRKLLKMHLKQEERIPTVAILPIMGVLVARIQTQPIPQAMAAPMLPMVTVLIALIMGAAAAARRLIAQILVVPTAIQLIHLVMDALVQVIQTQQMVRVLVAQMLQIAIQPTSLIMGVVRVAVVRILRVLILVVQTVIQLTHLGMAALAAPIQIQLMALAMAVLTLQIAIVQTNQIMAVAAAVVALQTAQILAGQIAIQQILQGMAGRGALIQIQLMVRATVALMSLMVIVQIGRIMGVATGRVVGQTAQKLVVLIVTALTLRAMAELAARTAIHRTVQGGGALVAPILIAPTLRIMAVTGNNFFNK
jgi:hypothetical protein